MMKTIGFNNWLSEYYQAAGQVTSGLRKIATVPDSQTPLTTYVGVNSFRQILTMGLMQYNSGLERICKLTITGLLKLNNNDLNGENLHLRKYGHSIKKMMNEIKGLNLPEGFEFEPNFDVNYNNLVDFLDFSSTSSSRYIFLEDVLNERISMDESSDLWSRWCNLQSSVKNNEMSSCEHLIHLANSEDKFIIDLSNFVSQKTSFSNVETLLVREHRYSDFYTGAIFQNNSSFISYEFFKIAKDIFKLHDMVTDELWVNNRDILRVPLTREIGNFFFDSTYSEYIAHFLIGVEDLEIFLESLEDFAQACENDEVEV